MFRQMLEENIAIVEDGGDPICTFRDPSENVFLGMRTEDMRTMIPQGQAMAEMVAEHYDEMLRFYGAELGAKVARKHLGWYMDEAATPAPLRRDILTAKDPKDVLRLLPDALLGSAPATGGAAA